MRAFIAILVGFALWSALWVGGHQGVFGAAPQLYDADGIPISPTTYAGYLAFSLVCSYAAGWLASKLAPRGSRAVLGLGVVLLLVGIGFQASVWNREPLWYHLAFLALLLPTTLMGGRKAGARAA